MNAQTFRLQVFVAIVTVVVSSRASAQTGSATPAPQVEPAPGAPPPPGQWPPPAQPYPYQQQAPQYPGWPPPPPGSVAPNGQYVAPLSQTTQPSYIPQSVALSGPRRITDWSPDQPVPPGYHTETRMRKGSIIAGLITFGVPYIYSSLIAAVGEDANETSVRPLWVPVLGPFLEIGYSHSVTLDYVLVLDGLTQALGAGLVIYGITSPRTVLIRNDLAMVHLMPMRLGHDGNGVGFIGRF